MKVADLKPVPRACWGLTAVVVYAVLFVGLVVQTDRYWRQHYGLQTSDLQQHERSARRAFGQLEALQDRARALPALQLEHVSEVPVPVVLAEQPGPVVRQRSLPVLHVQARDVSWVEAATDRIEWLLERGRLEDAAALASAATQKEGAGPRLKALANRLGLYTGHRNNPALSTEGESGWLVRRARVQEAAR